MIILSCGHKTDDLDNSFNVITKESDRRGEKALAYRSVCAKCKKEYEINGELLKSEADGLVWLNEENW